MPSEKGPYPDLMPMDQYELDAYCITAGCENALCDRAIGLGSDECCECAGEKECPICNGDDESDGDE